MTAKRRPQPDTDPLAQSFNQTLAVVPPRRPIRWSVGIIAAGCILIALVFIVAVTA